MKLEPRPVPTVGVGISPVIALHDDAEERSWISEAARHQHVANAITDHLRTIEIRL